MIPTFVCGYDQILVLYNFDSFKSDPYLYRAGVQG